MKVLLTGATGQLGQSLLKRFPKEWHILAPSSSIFNLQHERQIREFIQDRSIDVIINAAAYTAVDLANTDQKTAFAINTLAPSFMAQLAHQFNIRFFHLSSDYVFDGKKVSKSHLTASVREKERYTELDSPLPLNTYGLSKLLGEQKILRHNPHSTIIRTSWAFSQYGQNFVKTMLRLGLQKSPLHVVDDQWGCPSYIGDVAQTLIELIQRPEIPAGIYHYSGKEVVSWFEFARQIFQIASQYNSQFAQVHLEPISTQNYIAQQKHNKTIANRPMYSALSCAKIAQYGIQNKSYLKGLEEVVRENFVQKNPITSYTKQ